MPRAKDQKGGSKLEREFSRFFSVVYEDNDIIVVDKQPGIVSAPHKHGSGGQSLLSEVSRYLRIRSKRNLGAHAIHRLDRDTSGVLLFAKSPRLAKRIKEEFKEKKPERTYIAVVRGKVKQRSGRFESYLATDKDLNMYSTKDTSKGKLAITHFRVEKILEDTTLIEVNLETGRRNQIRVHFAEIGHPVIGDVRYKPELAKHKRWPHRRLALHALSLRIFHPTRRKMMSFKSELPIEFVEFLKD